MFSKLVSNVFTIRLSLEDKSYAKTDQRNKDQITIDKNTITIFFIIIFENIKKDDLHTSVAKPQHLKLLIEDSKCKACKPPSFSIKSLFILYCSLAIKI